MIDGSDTNEAVNFYEMTAASNNPIICENNRDR